MRKILLLVIALTLSLPVFAGVKGNGAPSGDHFDLNIIAVPVGKTANLTNSDRHTIFVPLAVDGETVPDITDIFLTQGPFEVCDGNGFLPPVSCPGQPPIDNEFANANGAVFQLPCNTAIVAQGVTTLIPCVAGTMESYSVWARVVGTPGGTTSTITTCAEDELTETLVCSVNPGPGVAVFQPKTNKPPVFTDVTVALTSIVTASNTIQLFAPNFEGFFWAYDNDGAKVLQLRFYGI